MARLLGFLSSLISIYMMIIFFRIMLSWFSGMRSSGFLDILNKITDPYLNWFRRFPILRVGYLDLSPIVALGVLSLVNRIFSTLARYGTITLGIILALLLQALWGAASFFLGFLIVVLVLRIIAHLARVDMYGPFWRIVDTISRPVLYKINRILFKDRIVNFTVSLIISTLGMGLIYLLLRIIVIFAAGALARLPV